jgi:hypothetical protein
MLLQALNVTGNLCDKSGLLSVQLEHLNYLFG